MSNIIIIWFSLYRAPLWSETPVEQWPKLRLHMTFQMLWPLNKPHYDSLQPQITSLWNNTTTSYHDFSNAVAFEQNKLWWPPTTNNLPVTFQILWPSVKKNYISLWWRVTSLWYLICYIIQQQWTVVIFRRKGKVMVNLSHQV